MWNELQWTAALLTMRVCLNFRFSMHGGKA